MKEIISQAQDFVRARLSGEGTGHDWWHIERVWKTAHYLAEKEGGDLLVIELAALLHDIADWKFHGGDAEAGPKAATAWLSEHGVPQEIIAKVTEVIRKVSFKGANVREGKLSLEAKIVQDADRLDALGAIGIARCFAYGGSIAQPLYDPALKPTLHQSAEDYVKSKSHSVNHFYEKLLLLKDRLHTETAKTMAARRHQFMETFLAEFYREWQSEF